jgi:hypothetical protein
MKNFFTIIFLFSLVIAGCIRPEKSETTKDRVHAVAPGKPDITQEQPGDTMTEESVEAAEASSGPPPYPGSQELWTYQFYGFSPDLVNTAFSTTGHDDYNWVGYEFYVVNVNKNDFSSKPYRERFEEELPEDLSKTIAGKLALYKLPEKTGFVKTVLNSAKAENAINIKGHNYLLKLFQTAIGDYKIFELQLTDPSTNKLWVLQKDKKLPVSRGSVKGYRLKDAYVQNNKLAVMLEMDMESYEFESYWYYPTKYMMVTGAIN